MPRPLIDALEPRQLFTATLTAGQTIQTGIKSSAPSKNYVIALKAGQDIAIAAGDVGTGSFAPEVILIGPDRKTVARSSGDTGAFMNKTAPTTGNYTIRVRDLGQDQYGSVKLTAFFTGSTTVTDSDDAGQAQSGRRFAATIGPGDLDVWRFTSTGNQFLSVVANENANGAALDIGVIIVGPDGKGVTAKENAAGFAIDIPKTAKGTYYAVAFEPGFNATGRYGISFGVTPGVQTTEDPDTQTTLSNGETRTGDLPSGDIDLFQVSLAKGKTVTAKVARNGSTVTPAILLIDPNGTVVASTSGSTTASLGYKTLTAGTYSILVRNRDADTGGSYKLTYTLA